MIPRRTSVRVATGFVVLSLTLLSCTSSAGGTAPQTPTEAAPTSQIGASATPTPAPMHLRPAECPTNFQPWLHRNDVPGIRQTLVPGDPIAAVGCLRGKHVTLTDPTDVGRLVRALNGLKLVQPGAVFNCALYMSPIGAVFFAYGSGDVLTVEIGAACNTASNGRRQAFLGRATDEISRLVLRAN